MISPFYLKHKTRINIHVFKTNIETEADMNSIQFLLNPNPKIIKWSVDLEDIDRVLRIDASKYSSEKDIIDMVKSKGFYCEELE